MFKKYKIEFLFFVLIFLLMPVNFLYAIAENENNLSNYLKYFYNRYSQHFDEQGLKYSSPTYEIIDFKSPETAREWMSLSLILQISCYK